MTPGLYVVRLPQNGLRLKIESICFRFQEDKKRFPDHEVWQQAQNWCDFIQGQHPKDDVFVIEKRPPAPPTYDV